MKIKSSESFWTVETKSTSLKFPTRDLARNHKRKLKSLFDGTVEMYKNTQLFNTDLMPDTVVIYKERKH